MHEGGRPVRQRPQGRCAATGKPGRKLDRRGAGPVGVGDCRVCAVAGERLSVLIKAAAAIGAGRGGVSAAWPEAGLGVCCGHWAWAWDNLPKIVNREVRGHGGTALAGGGEEEV